MKVSIIVLATNPDGDCVSFNSVFYVSASGEFDLTSIRKPTTEDIQSAISKVLDNVCKEAKRMGLKITSSSHCIFE